MVYSSNGADIIIKILKMPLLLNFQGSFVPRYMLPFNGIYGKHHNVVEKMWALDLFKSQF